AGIPLLVVVQTLESDVEGRVRLRPPAAAGRGALARPVRQAAVDDGAAERVGAFLLFSAGELLAGGAVPRRERPGLRAARSDLRNKTCGGGTRAGSRPRGSRQRYDGRRKSGKQRKPHPDTHTHSPPHRVASGRPAPLQPPPT